MKESIGRREFSSGLAAMMFAPYLPALETACGKERWNVKLLKDPDAAKIDFKPVVATISALAAFPAPTRKELMAAENSRFGHELMTYSVTGTLMGFKLEADGDFHIVVSDGKRTIIVEIPSPDCASGSYKEDFKRERDSWEVRFGKAEAKFQNLAKKKIRIGLQGVGFFDVIHGQTGVAKNGFELHPLLAWSEVIAKD